MALNYGFAKCTVVSEPRRKPSRHGRETQSHLHATLEVPSEDGESSGDTVINVGTNDADDLLQYKLVYDFHHPIIEALKAAPPGFHDLTGTSAFPALDFLRSNLLADTGRWRDSDVMDGSDQGEPVLSAKRLLHQAKADRLDVYIFGRTHQGGDLGFHDIQMNQGSSGSFVNNGRDDHNDRNDAWQDGGILVDMGDGRWAG